VFLRYFGNELNLKQIFTDKEDAVDFRKNLLLETVLDKLDLASCLGASPSVSVTNIAKILSRKSQNQTKSAGVRFEHRFKSAAFA
jgi:hypothetical protein